MITIIKSFQLHVGVHGRGMWCDLETCGNVVFNLDLPY